MSAIIVMVLISLFLACGFLFAFLWAAHTGQFRDSQTPAIRILHEQPSTKVRTGKKKQGEPNDE